MLNVRFSMLLPGNAFDDQTAPSADKTGELHIDHIPRLREGNWETCGCTLPIFLSKFE